MCELCINLLDKPDKICNKAFYYKCRGNLEVLCVMEGDTELMCDWSFWLCSGGAGDRQTADAPGARRGPLLEAAGHPGSWPIQHAAGPSGGGQTLPCGPRLRHAEYLAHARRPTGDGGIPARRAVAE